MKWKIRRTKYKWLLFGTLGCVSVYMILSFSQMHRRSSRFEEGEQFLQAQAASNVDEVNHQVAKVNQSIQLSYATSLEEELRIRFQNSVVVGDSIAEAFSDYHLLTASNVVAKRGMRTDNCEADIDRVIALAPTNVFLSYGMNDLAYCRGDENCFTSQYEQVLKKLKEGLPNAHVFVSAILPTTQAATRSTPVYKAYTTYNEALKALCVKEEVTYYDASDLLIDEDAYEKDGVHPTYTFYPQWLQRMVDMAGG